MSQVVSLTPRLPARDDSLWAVMATIGRINAR